MEEPTSKDSSPAGNEPSGSQHSELKPAPIHGIPPSLEIGSFLNAAKEGVERVTATAVLAEKAAHRCTDHENMAHKKASSAQSSADRAAAALRDVEQGVVTTLTSRDAIIEVRALVEKQAGEIAGTVASINNSQTAAQDALNAIAQVRERIEALATQSAERSDHIQRGKEHADSVRAKIDGWATQSESAKTRAEAQAQAAQERAAEGQEIVSGLRAHRQSAAETTKEIASDRQQAAAYLADAKALADRAETVQASLNSYELKLAELVATFEAKNKQIESLLPGATSAGLASAFEARGEGFKVPQRWWQAAFLASLGGLLVVAVVELRLFDGALAVQAGTAPEYKDLLRMLIHRLPLIAPLVWLAIYSARQAALAKRLEEEYGFKASVARSFEGFRRQMAEVAAGGDERSPVLRLCNDVLRTIAAPPGRIYEKHRPDQSPANAVAETVPQVANAVARAASSVKKGD